MANERYPQDDYYGRTDPQDYRRDYGSGRDQSYGGARDYQAAGTERGGRQGGGGDDYGRRDQYGQGGGQGGSGDRYGRADRDFAGQRDSGYYQGGGQDRGRYGASGGGDYGQSRYGQSRYEQSSYGRSDYGQSDYGRSEGGRSGYGQGSDYRGSYASDGRRFEDVGRYRDADDDDRQRRGGSYGRQSQGEERGFFDRAGDEVRSWFGDEDAERRREMDARRDEREAGERYGSDSHSDYRNWRRQQLDALDRDYDEYRQQNRSKFDNEFGTWRTGRQGQRDLLNKVNEHQEVVGSDGEHVGTVDKVRGDRVILTKNDQDAGGHHHSFPSSWLQSVDDKVTLSRTAAEAKAAWKDEERKGAMSFGDDRSKDQGRTEQTSGQQTGQSSGGQTGGTTDLNRSFSGTY